MTAHDRNDQTNIVLAARCSLSHIHTAAASEDWETWCNHSQTDVASARNFVVSSAQLALEGAADALGRSVVSLSSMTTLPPAGLRSHRNGEEAAAHRADMRRAKSALH